MPKLVDIYKNKFQQLKNAYSESETEKEKIRVSLEKILIKIFIRHSFSIYLEFFS